MTNQELDTAPGRAGTDQQARERILSLIAFLKEVDAIEHPPVTDIARYGGYLLNGEDIPDVPGVELTGGGGAWLTVRFVDLPSPPPIPADLANYLPSSKQLSASQAPSPSTPDTDKVPDPNDSSTPYIDSPTGQQRLQLAHRWVVDQWEPWSRRWKEAQQAKEFYRRLFEQQELIDANRETYELVWGFGRTRWRNGDRESLHHPLFTIVVEVASGRDGQLIVQPVGALELETLPFSNVELADRGTLNAQREATANSPFDPWTQEILTDAVRSAVRALAHDGVVEGEGEQQANAPSADVGWVLYTRKKRPDRQAFLDRMRDLYASGATPPEALSSVVVDTPSDYEVDDAISGLPSSECTEGWSTKQREALLLPLPSNEEQQLILRRAQHQSGVVVQGPPGTGKSHTIANLVSHYVAYGHRVLVVAEKEQALTVLAKKIPKGIRTLTVSVLGSTTESRSALESSITSIQARVAGLDRAVEDQRIASLTETLTAVDAEIAETTGRLLAARRAEVEVLPGVWPVHSSPQNAADWVRNHEAELGYITDAIGPDAPAPLRPEELADLVRLLRTIGLERARETTFALPSVSDLPSGSTLAELFLRRRTLRADLDTALPEVTDWTPIDRAASSDLEELSRALSDELEHARASESGWLSSIAGQLDDPLLSADWCSFLESTRSDREQLLSLRRQLQAHDVVVPVAPTPGFKGDLEQARIKLAARGKLGLFAGDARRAVEACQVDGAVPSTSDTVEVCQHMITLNELRTTLRTRWANQVSPLSGPELSHERPEDEIGRHLEDMERILTGRQRWSQLMRDLQSVGIHSPSEYGSTTIARLIDVMRLVPTRVEQLEIDRRLNDVASFLVEGGRQENASPHWQSLRDAFGQELTETWERCRDEVAELVALVPDARRLVSLSATLRAAAPSWAELITADPMLAGDPAVFPAAWQWRQLDTWISRIMSADSPQALQRQLEDLAVRRRRLVEELVETQAWRRLKDSLQDRHKQALGEYLGAVKRFGKTGGKFAARWQAAIRDALNSAKDAVPVWIMTTNAALRSFRPDAEVPFDVVIIDESSQIGIEDVPLLALAQKAIVVGDDKQTSPAAVGTDQQRVFDLIDSHLRDIPNSRTLFNPGNSLYDAAKQKFPSQIMLREHFRSLHEIIEFSNATFYEGRIEPLRENRPTARWAALGAVRVLDGFRRHGTNENEAEANVVTDLIGEMVEDAAFDRMDFGVITLLAGEQAELIRRKLFDRLGPETITKRRIRVGDPANFQGDERDVVIVSTVVGTDPENPGRRMRAMTSEADAQRINVAASRARNRMMVVHSIDPEQFPRDDLRAALIRHCRNPWQTVESVEEAIKNCDSEFERLVLRRIVAKGYSRVRSQVRVGAENQHYRIDLVVDGPSSRLAVECDGEKWHGPERWDADRVRQEVLERAGWVFCRIRGSAFFRSPDEALEPLWSRLEELGIPTGDDWVAESSRSETVFERYGLASPTEGTSVDDDPVAQLDLSQNQWVDEGDALDQGEGVAGEEETDASTPTPASESLADEVLPLAAEASMLRGVSDGEPARSAHGVPADSRPAEHDVLLPLFPDDGPTAPVTQDQAESRNRVVTSPQLTRRGSIHLAPYTSFQGRALSSITEGNRAEVAEGLNEIVRIEGPILAKRAYQQYVKASGRQRLGREMKHVLNSVLSHEMRAGRILALQDDVQGMIGKTLYLAGSEPVVLRDLGPRTLSEVPRSELSTLLRLLGLDDVELRPHDFRAVLDAYSLTRLTPAAEEYIQDSQTYSYQM